MTRLWKTVFGMLVFAGIFAAVIRFGKGLGAATNLSDEFPWGLWIGFDVLVGVGLAAGGFVVAATVHIFQMKKYEAVGRPAILTAFLGYLLVIVAILFDIGRPYRIWHPLVMGNPHSVMFEVAMCVMLYTAVLALEFSPLLFARFGLKMPMKIVRAAYIPLVIAGVLLSTLHQSSLGTLYVIVPGKLHDLWYTPMLPIFFYLSAIAAGLGMTIFESFMSYRAFGKRLERDLLEGIARVMVVVLAILAVWRIGNLIDRGALHYVFELSQESVMFWGEAGLGILLPMVLFAIPKVRSSQSGLFLGAVLTIMGFILNRLNVAITGFVRSSGVNYIPSWMEFAVTAGIIALGFYLFGLAVKHFEVFPKEHTAQVPVTSAGLTMRGRPILQTKILLGLWSLLLIGFLLHGVATRREAAAEAEGDGVAVTAVEPYMVGLGSVPSLVDGIEIPMGEDSPGPVLFDHSSHVDADDPHCCDCHLSEFSILGEGAARRESVAASVVTMEQMEAGRYCGACHDGENAFSCEDDCDLCHEME